MSEFTQGILLALVPSLIVSILTAYVTVRLSMRQFYSQRWWEKKAEAYSQIIEHLSYLLFYFGEWYSEGINEKQLKEDDKQKLWIAYGKAKESITKAAATGAYIVSGDTATTLAKLLRDLERTDPKGDWIGDIDRCYGAVKMSLDEIKEHANSDLQLGKTI